MRENGVSYKTLRSNAERYMARYVEEYEKVKAKEHKEYRYAKELFKDKGICYQNFYKFYRRFKESGRKIEELLPRRRGPKAKYLELPLVEEDILVRKVLGYREKGYNKFVIAECLRKDKSIKKACSESTIYRIFVRYKVSKLSKKQQEERRKIIREHAGSLVHIDCHELPKGIVMEHPLKRYYALGAQDTYSRIVWVEVLETKKAIDATFGMMDAILALHQEYGIKCDEVLTDNGSEFCGGEKTMNTHPFERLLAHFGIKHRRTRPYRPQTNGKIERFWRVFDEEVIEGAEFNTLDELKDAVLGYNFYYNQYRPHQGINGQRPMDMLTQPTKTNEHLS